jgi:hypothetical protein
VIKKPHVTKIESKGRPDAQIAAESWRRYLLRNDSELVDRCFGQMKSHVTCTSCGNESVTFDVYSSLSLPLPIRTTRPITIIAQLLPLTSLPVKFDMEVEIGATMRQFEKAFVDKLVELKLLGLSSTAHESTASMGQTSPADSADGSTTPAITITMDVEDGSRTCTTDVSKASSPSANDTYESFELVGHPLKAGIAETVQSGSDAAYVTVFEDDDRMDDSHTSASTSPLPCPSEDLPVAEAVLAGLSDPSKQNPTTAVRARTGPHFHFGTLFATRHSSIFKYYNSAESGATAVHSFIGRNDSLVAFQLEHWAPEVRSVPHYSTSYNRAPPTVYDPADADCGYVAVEVCMGSKVVSQYSSYERIEYGGYPYRLSLPENCTNTYVHKQIATLSRRFLKEDSPYCTSGLSSLPYTVMVTSHYGSAQGRRTIPVDDEVFQLPAASSEVLAVVWNSDFEEHVDQDQVDAVRSPAVDEVAKTKAGTYLSVLLLHDRGLYCAHKPKLLVLLRRAAGHLPVLRQVQRAGAAGRGRDPLLLRLQAAPGTHQEDGPVDHARHPGGAAQALPVHPGAVLRAPREDQRRGGLPRGGPGPQQVRHRDARGRRASCVRPIRGVPPYGRPGRRALHGHVQELHEQQVVSIAAVFCGAASRHALRKVTVSTWR